MNILIIKNDGFGDFILIRDLIKKIDNKKHFISIVLSKNNGFLSNELKNINKKYIFDSYGPNFFNKKKISKSDKLNLNNLKRKRFDLCIVLRRYLNDEQILILNEINVKSIVLCHEYLSSKVELTRKYEQIKIPDTKINDYDYFSYFLKKINLINNNKLKLIKKNVPSKKYLVLNLSGEKQFKNINNLNILLNTIKKNYNNKIYIIGKTIDKKINKEILNTMRKLNMKNIVNLWNKTDFLKSMQIINNSEYYIGFDTGLSHYSCMINKRSLIILNSGGNHKWFPYPSDLKNNITYWTFNTPCAGCNFSGHLNKCFYKIRYCVDNIFLNKKKINFEFKNFIRNNKNVYLNFSKYNYFLSDWTYVGKKNKLFFINKNGKLNTSVKNISNFFFVFKNWVSFYYTNKINFFLNLKILIKNLICFFYNFKFW